MKNIKNLWVLVLTVIAFTSCDSNDTDRTFYYPANTEAAFKQNKSAYTFGAEDPDQYTVTVMRGNAEGAASIPVKLSDESGLFNASSAIEFANGELEALITVTFNRQNLETGKAYTITLEIPENPIKEHNVLHTLAITRDYVWEAYTTGNFTSEFFETEWEVTMEKADGTDVYRLADVYADGYHISFAVEGNNIVPMVAASGGLYPFATGYVDSGYGPVSFQIDADPEYTNIDMDNKTLTLNGRFVVADGSFGWFDEIFTW